MHSRPLLLSLSAVALVGLTACMSVSAEPAERPTAPRVTPAGDRSPLPGGARPTPVAVHGKVSDATTPAGSKRARGAESSAASDAKARPAGEGPAAVPAQGGRQTPVGRPDPAVPRPALPVVPKSGAEGEMKQLCDASSGITDPGVTGLCRGAYG
ncbi:hypothetical protein [Streptomyces sp. NBC_00690]|uniref:hypothetical protein n=1 Tax=Streptomyces sp. NBC_00690 TaxID=2975808 RepID=UPI002E2826E2|nr:hypothetical protein [Streptomyces sp. NBC_00690]